jgi:hypothetical protein
MDLGEFCIFARDFNIKIPKHKIMEIFKKTSDFRRQPLNLTQFRKAIDKIGVAINQERMDGLQKRIDEIEKIEQEKADKAKKTEAKMDTKNKSAKDNKNTTKSNGFTDATGIDNDKKSHKGPDIDEITEKNDDFTNKDATTDKKDETVVNLNTKQDEDDSDKHDES